MSGQRRFIEQGFGTPVQAIPRKFDFSQRSVSTNNPSQHRIPHSQGFIIYPPSLEILSFYLQSLGVWESHTIQTPNHHICILRTHDSKIKLRDSTHAMYDRACDTTNARCMMLGFISSKPKLGPRPGSTRSQVPQGFPESSFSGTSNPEVRGFPEHVGS